MLIAVHQAPNLNLDLECSLDGLPAVEYHMLVHSSGNPLGQTASPPARGVQGIPMGFAWEMGVVFGC